MGSAVLDGHVVFVGPNGLIGLDRLPLHQPITGAPLLSPVTVLNAREHRIAVVELGEARVTFLDSANSRTSIQLLAPDIQGVSRPPRTNTEYVPALIDAAIDQSKGDIYALINPVNINNGAVVLQFSTDGHLKNKYICSLPRLDSLKTAINKDGHFTVTHIAFLHGKLIFMSARQKQGLYYDVVP
jgi:hypothetical protein